MAKFKWLDSLMDYLTQTSFFIFEWDEGNKFKSEIKHKVSPEEAESSFYDLNITPLGIQISPESVEDRYGILGMSYNNRIIFSCFTFRDGKIRVISSRVSNKREEDLYER